MNIKIKYEFLKYYYNLNNLYKFIINIKLCPKKKENLIF